MKSKKVVHRKQPIFADALFIALAAFFSVGLSACSEDECHSHSDCEDEEGCVGGKCVEISSQLGAERPSPGGGGSTINMQTTTPTDSDTDDSDPLAPGGAATDTSDSELDTAYGALPGTLLSNSSDALPLGCVIYHGNYYTCSLLETLTTESCDLINEDGCSPDLFPEACKVLLAGAAGVTINTVCYSPLQNNTGDAPEFDCIEVGGEWMPCPFQEQ